MLLLAGSEGAQTELIKTIPDIIKAAAASNLGILALLILLVGFICYFFFRDASFHVRVWIFLSVLAGVVVFGAAVLLAQRQEARDALARELRDARSKEDQRVQRLILKLIFPEQRSGRQGSDVPVEVNPFAATVDAFVQKKNEAAERQIASDFVRPIRGAGGIALEFRALDAGDKLHVVITYAGKVWRSDDLIIPEAKLDVSRVVQ